MKLRICLDTSVFSAYYDGRHPERQAETREFWTRVTEFEASASELAREDLGQTPDAELRGKFVGLLEGFTIHPVTEEVRELARRYVSSGAFGPAQFNDATHVATAVLTRQDVLLSWNFKHLVNRRRRAKINEMNVSRGLPTIEILAPPEV